MKFITKFQLKKHTKNPVKNKLLLKMSNNEIYKAVIWHENRNF